MPKLNDVYGGNFLKKDHLQGPTVFTILGSGETEFEDGKKQITLRFKETDKVLGLNMTNANICAKAFESFDSDDWTGKRIEAYVDPNVMMHGKIVGGVRLRLPNDSKSDQPATTPAGGGQALDDDIPF